MERTRRIYVSDNHQSNTLSKMALWLRLGTVLPLTVRLVPLLESGEFTVVCPSLLMYINMFICSPFTRNPIGLRDIVATFFDVTNEVGSFVTLI